MKTTHVAYSDESQHNIGRYRAIGMISLPVEHIGRISTNIQQELNQSEVAEARWKKIKGARDRFAAQKVINICLQEARQKNIRADVVIWDTHDKRHAIQGRDDNKNLHNMYVQLFKNVLRKRWSIESTWQIFPDENSIIDWSFVKNTLANTDRFTARKANLLGDDWLTLRTHFGIVEVSEVSSKEVYLAQAADLFAGMGVFSYEYLKIYQSWVRQNSPQIEMFESKARTLTSKEEEHSRVLHEFALQVNKYSLGVSITTSHGLYTNNPSNPINYWFYRPQYNYDKAPIRASKSKKNQ